MELPDNRLRPSPGNRCVHDPRNRPQSAVASGFVPDCSSGPFSRTLSACRKRYEKLGHSDCVTYGRFAVWPNRRANTNRASVLRARRLPQLSYRMSWQSAGPAQVTACTLPPRERRWSALLRQLGRQAPVASCSPALTVTSERDCSALVQSYVARRCLRYARMPTNPFTP